jgi:hypothetical protein
VIARCDCGSAAPPGREDAHVEPDASSLSDAGSVDAWMADAEATDSATSDGGAPDASLLDAGAHALRAVEITAAAGVARGENHTLAGRIAIPPSSGSGQGVAHRLSGNFGAPK